MRVLCKYCSLSSADEVPAAKKNDLLVPGFAHRDSVVCVISGYAQAAGISSELLCCACPSSSAQGLTRSAYGAELFLWRLTWLNQLFQPIFVRLHSVSLRPPEKTPHNRFSPFLQKMSAQDGKSRAVCAPPKPPSLPGKLGRPRSWESRGVGGTLGEMQPDTVAVWALSVAEERL